VRHQPADGVVMVGNRRLAVLVGGAVTAVVAALYFIGAGRDLNYDGIITSHYVVLTRSLLDPFTAGGISSNNHVAFSFIEHLVYTLTGIGSERALRVVPILAGATACGVLGATVTLHLGGRAGVAAAGVLATNPLFASQAREVRGYSLVTLCVVVASYALIRMRSRDHSLAWQASYVAAMALAVATHYLVAAAVIAHAIVLVAMRSLPVRRVAALAASALTIGALAYIRLYRSFLQYATTATATNRERADEVHTLGRLGRALLGGAWLAVLLLGYLMAVAVWRHRHRFGLLLGLACAAAAPLALVVRGVPWSPRFFVWLAPVVAVGVASEVGRRPRALVAVGIAVLASAASLAPRWREPEHAITPVAMTVDQVATRGGQSCAPPFTRDVLVAYTSRFRTVSQPSEITSCDVLVTVAPAADLFVFAWIREVTRHEFPFRHRYAGGSTVYSRRDLQSWQTAVARPHLLPLQPR
jgi:hypothetical protein